MLNFVNFVELPAPKMSRQPRCWDVLGCVQSRLTDSKLKWSFPRLSWQSHAAAERTTQARLNAEMVVDRTMVIKGSA